MKIAKRITDPVHGTIGLTQLEVDVISSPTFQRLHNVKQLGLASLIYPGANYSRFAHSLGACHVMAELLRAIEMNSGAPVDEETKRQYRLAALLHDIGHYPFSHIAETAVEDFYKGSAFLSPLSSANSSNVPNATGSDGSVAAYNHESLGRQIIQYDKHLAAVFGKHGIDHQYVTKAFLHEVPNKHLCLISSDLDCDRLDYMMRTSLHAGLPYGAVDVGYIISQMTKDAQGTPCLGEKAARAADHMLISRYFDYMQVAFHKTVVGLELTLKDVLLELLKRELLDWSAKGVRKEIESGAWCEADDLAVLHQIRTLRRGLGDNVEDETLRTKIQAILERRAPKLVAQIEVIADAGEERVHIHNDQVGHVQQSIPRWAEKFGIAQDRWHVWKKKLKLTSRGSKVNLGDTESISEEEKAQLVRIQRKRRGVESVEPLINIEGTLVNKLSNYRFYGIRIYVHLTDDKLREAINTEIRGTITSFQ